MIERTYRNRDGFSDMLKFCGDWTFGTELLEYVNQTYGAARWAIDSCRQITPVQYVARFRPFYEQSNGPLYIYVSYNEDSEVGWSFSQRPLKQ